MTRNGFPPASIKVFRIDLWLNSVGMRRSYILPQQVGCKISPLRFGHTIKEIRLFNIPLISFHRSCVLVSTLLFFFAHFNKI